MRTFIGLAAFAFLASFSQALVSAEDAWLTQKTPGFLAFYKDLHQNPELSLEEKRTSALLAKALAATGAKVTTNIGGYGVVAVLQNGEGPVVLVRSDMDALPVTELTKAEYASQATATDAEGRKTGVMHACGHDIHMTCLVGTAQWLADHRDQWSGTVVFIGQPAEERVEGARAMLKDGLYTRFPKPSAALALHVAHDLPVGSVGYIAGPSFASSTSVDITVKGRGGHGAMPHNASDPIVQAAMLVVDLQTIVSRQVSPIDAGVVTVGSIHGGTKHNIIPNDVKLQLTIRAFKDETREMILSSIRRKAEGLAHAHNSPKPEVEIREGITPTVNDPGLVARTVPAFEAALGKANVVGVEPTTGAEDFGLYSEGGVPAFMFRLGTVKPERIKAARSGGAPLPQPLKQRFEATTGARLIEGYGLTETAGVATANP
ncbi:MAG: amidohydrolase, partial [bacterium]